MVSTLLAIFTTFIASSVALQRACGNTPSVAQVAAYEADFAAAQNRTAPAKRGGLFTGMFNATILVSLAPRKDARDIGLTQLLV